MRLDEGLCYFSRFMNTKQTTCLARFFEIRRLLSFEGCARFLSTTCCLFHAESSLCFPLEQGTTNFLIILMKFRKNNSPVQLGRQVAWSDFTIIMLLEFMAIELATELAICRGIYNRKMESVIVPAHYKTDPPCQNGGHQHVLLASCCQHLMSDC